MLVIAKEPLRAWIVQGASIILTTIFVCYGVAVYLGHVPAWLPMISDCAVLPPEKYIFRLGIVTGAIFLAIEAKLIYHADSSFTYSKSGLILGIIASIGLAIVGVVNEKENNSIHSTAAVIMFLAYIINMNVFSFLSDAAASTGFVSMMIKRICAVVGAVSFVTFVFMSLDWSKYQIEIAMCEWIGTFTIMIFSLTFGADVGGLYLCEVREQCEVHKQQNCDDDISAGHEKKIEP